MNRCLILQGGGLRGAFVAGASFALDDLGIRGFESAFAVSASVPTLAYFLAGQCRESREVWENYLCTRKLIRYSAFFQGWLPDYKVRPLIDLHYLVLDVFRDRFPLNVKRLMDSPTDAYFVAADGETYRPCYFGKDPDNMYGIMRACMALPGAVPEKPMIDGRTYVDGGIVDPLPVEKALEMGADRLLVILTTPPGHVSKKVGLLERLAAGQYFKNSPGLLDTCLMNGDSYGRSLRLLEELKERDSAAVLVVRPEAPLPAPRVTRDRKKIVRTVKEGYGAVMKNERDIRSLLNDEKGKARKAAKDRLPAQARAPAPGREGTRHSGHPAL